MADLDDFFAKKDKKKKTKKFSKANVDELAKNLEETDKKEQRQADTGTLATSQANSEENDPEKKKKVEAEDDWDDYHENKKDYTGLKIENLKVEEEVEEEEEEEEQMNEDGEMVSVKKGESGPWNKKSGSKNNSTDIPDEKEKEPTPATIQLPGVNKQGGYVPPHLRGGNTAATTERRPMARNRVKNAPDINSEVYFPSLSAGTDDAGPKGAWGKKLSGRNEGQFEEVRERQGQSHNNRSSASDQPKLSLGNKFDLLTED